VQADGAGGLFKFRTFASLRVLRGLKAVLAELKP